MDNPEKLQIDVTSPLWKTCSVNELEQVSVSLRVTQKVLTHYRVTHHAVSNLPLTSVCLPF